MEMKSAHQTFQTVDLGGSCPEPAPGPTPLEVEEILRAAWDVTRSLKGMRPPSEIARRAQSPLAYGIGMMMFRLVEKKIISCDETAYDSLLCGMPGARGRNGGQAPANRRTVIDHLRKNMIIERAISVRALKPSGSTPTVAHVLRVTDSVMGVTPADVLSRNRSRPIVTARFFAMWSLRTVSGTSFSVIGDHFGGKDHTTVINAVNQVDIRRSNDQGDRANTDQIVDEADLIGIKSSMDMLIRQASLKVV